MSSALPDSVHPTPPPAAPTDTAVAWPDAQREAAFWRWFQPLATHLGLRADSLAPASADASFRRYLRVMAAHGSSRVTWSPSIPVTVAHISSLQQQSFHFAQIATIGSVK